MTMIYLILIGFFSGIISGMGIGGGTILIPALIFLQDIGQKEAQMVNLLYFVPTALIALYFHNKNKNIETKIIKPIILWGLLGAFAGAFLAVQMEADNLRKFFGVFLFCMGVSEFFKKDAKKKA